MGDPQGSPFGVAVRVAVRGRHSGYPGPAVVCRATSEGYTATMTTASRIPAADGATPAMAQWFAAKGAHPDALVFFRMGDFYELFFADAEAAVAALGIALTHRGEHAGVPVPMCGVPVHAAESYLLRLIRRGFRVAIAEQMEDPKNRSGKAPIRRAVVRLITPGTLTEDSLLESGRANLLLALAPTREAVGAAWLDVSTGSFETDAVAPADLPALLGRLDPAEIVAPETLLAALGEWQARAAPAPAGAAPPPLVARRRLAEAFDVASIDAFGGFSDAEAVAAALALAYVTATQAGARPLLAPPVARGRTGVLAMDAATRASLDILRARDGGAQHTLLTTVQRTRTPGGARLLADWLAAPLTDPAAIAARQDGWSWLLANPSAATALRDALRGAPDMPRALARLSLARYAPRDLATLRDGLAAAAAAAATLAGPLPAILAEAAAALAGTDPALAATLAAALADPAPARIEDGGAIRPGYDGELDAHCRLRDDSRRLIAARQADYAQRFGVASLKIRHHAQLGYVIEAPAAAVEKLRGFPELTLRQGMANGARFTLAELSELDRRIAEAADRAAARERLVLADLVRQALEQAAGLARAAAALALLDVLQSAASRAEGGSWCRPVVSDDDAFLIEAGRHPVVEAALAGSAAFVPNPCDLSADRRVLLLTGPNMAGKSTFLRQNAVLVILAQAGLPVPAAAARIGVVDRLFSRCRRRSGARAQHLHGGDDRDGGDPEPGRPAQPGGGGRDRSRHLHAGRAGDRLGGAGGAALGDPLPLHLRNALPRACGTGGQPAAAAPAHHARDPVAGPGGVPARGGAGGGGAKLGRACGAACRRAGAGGAPRRRPAGGAGEGWRTAAFGCRAAGAAAAVRGRNGCRRPAAGRARHRSAACGGGGAGPRGDDPAGRHAGIVPPQGIAGCSRCRLGVIASFGW
jgi:DNA mismatch repair protein MutS